MLLDDEKKYSFTPVDQGDWNKFVWSELIDLGEVDGGVHSITFETEGQTSGVADLDVFVLSAVWRNGTTSSIRTGYPRSGRGQDSAGAWRSRSGISSPMCRGHSRY